MEEGGLRAEWLRAGWLQAGWLRTDLPTGLLPSLPHRGWRFARLFAAVARQKPCSWRRPATCPTKRSVRLGPLAARESQWHRVAWSRPRDTRPRRPISHPLVDEAVHNSDAWSGEAFTW